MTGKLKKNSNVDNQNICNFSESPADAEKQVLDTFDDLYLNKYIFSFQDEYYCNIYENKRSIYYPLGTKNIRYKTKKRDNNANYKI